MSTDYEAVFEQVLHMGAKIGYSARKVEGGFQIVRPDGTIAIRAKAKDAEQLQRIWAQIDRVVAGVVDVLTGARPRASDTT